MKFLIVFVSWFFFALFFIGQETQAETAVNTDIKSALVAEFSSAYAKKISPKNEIVEINLVADKARISLVPKMEKTEVWSYNGQIPGPEIRIKLGQTLKIHFSNRLPQPTTLHFHGIRVPNSMDGVPGVTQPPIQPGKSFIYEFTPKDAGTFWYHPHERGSEQIERGLYGVIVVEETEPPPYDQDRVLVIDDWLLEQNSQIFDRFVTMHDVMHDGRWGNFITINGQSDFLLNAAPGERIRWRLVNPSNARVYALDFGSLPVKAIAVDGLAVRETFSAQNFVLSPGNRLDVEIAIPENLAEKNITIRDVFGQNANSLWQVQISSQKKQTPKFTTRTNPAIPHWGNAFSLPPDKTLKIALSGSHMSGLKWTLNGKSYPETDPIKIPAEKFTKLRLENQSVRLHPMHLHGQFFKVLARNGQKVDEPFFRDTILMYPEETIDIGLVALDKGRWANHCHTLEHADAGLMTIVEVR